MVLFLRRLCFGIVSAGYIVGGVHARAQQLGPAQSQLRTPLEPLLAVPMPQSTVTDELQAMAQQAGVIFAGQVLAVHAQNALGLRMGWVEIEFRVDDAIRGCAGQGTYVLREWAGLWAGGLGRYTVGQRLLMLLHAPGASGLSSPVGGQDGAIPISGDGEAPGPEDASVVQNERAVDLRWMEARLLRSPSPNQPLLSSALTAKAKRLAARQVSTPGVHRNDRFEPGRLIGAGLAPAEIDVAESVSSTGVNHTAEPTTLQAILTMLGAWESQQIHASR